MTKAAAELACPISGTTPARRASTSRACCSTAPTCWAAICASPISAAATPRPRSTMTGSADRRSRSTRALGQGLRRRPRLDEARRLRHALSRQARSLKRSIAASPMKTRWWRCSTTAPSISTRARPRSTRRCTASCRTAHVDHVHADAVIAIAASRQCRGADEGGLRRRDRLPALAAARLRPRPEARRDGAAHPDYVGVVLGGHGLFTWGPTSKACYETTLRIIQQAADWLAANEKAPAFGGARCRSRCRRRRAARSRRALMPLIRGRISARRAQGRPFHRRAGGAGVRQLARAGASSRRSAPPAPIISCAPRSVRWCCPSIRPTTRSSTRSAGARRAARRLSRRLCRLLRALQARRIRLPMRDPNAVIYLVPGVGMIVLRQGQGDGARSPREFYVNAINVMRGASGVGAYVGLAEQEAFDIEYWLLEEAKLQRMPKPKSLAGRVALITGGAGGIGRATAARLMGEGACVVLADIDQNALDDARRRFRAETFGKDCVRRPAARRDRRGGGRSMLRATPRSPSAASTSSSPTPASPRRRRSRTRRWRFGTRTWTILADRLFPGRARGVPADGSARARRRDSSSSPPRTASPPRPAPRPIARPRPRKFISRAAWRSRARRTASASTPSIPTPCCAARRSGRANGASSAPPPTRSARRRARGGLSPALDAEAVGASRGHRRGRLFLRLRPLGQIDRQHPQCRRRQRAGLHALVSERAPA